MKVNLYPLKFYPILNSVIWGGERIIPYKRIKSDQKMVGESWELSGVKDYESVVSNGKLEGINITQLLDNYGAELLGEANYQRFGNEFPLLVKFIDAKQDLSIQVHPNDRLAAERHNSKGKTEMWYVVDKDEGARLRSGFAKKVTPEEYVQGVENNTVTELLKEYEVNKGDIFFLPAGRIHSIGAGCFIAEIQQTSDITYRIYDFDRCDANGNARELHTELAKDAIDYYVQEDYRTIYDTDVCNLVQKVVGCPFFITSMLNLTRDITLDYRSLDSFVIYICTDGKCTVNEVPLQAGETLLLPASSKIIIIETEGCKILTTQI